MFNFYEYCRPTDVLMVFRKQLELFMIVGRKKVAKSAHNILDADGQVYSMNWMQAPVINVKQAPDLCLAVVAQKNSADGPRTLSNNGAWLPRSNDQNCWVNSWKWWLKADPGARPSSMLATFALIAIVPFVLLKMAKRSVVVVVRKTLATTPILWLILRPGQHSHYSASTTTLPISTWMTFNCHRTEANVARHQTLWCPCATASLDHQLFVFNGIYLLVYYYYKSLWSGLVFATNSV